MSLHCFENEGARIAANPSVYNLEYYQNNCVHFENIMALLFNFNFHGMYSILISTVTACYNFYIDNNKYVTCNFIVMAL